MTEAEFGAVRDRLKLPELAFGLEHFWLTPRTEHSPRRKSYPICELLAVHHPPFISTGEGWPRNSRYVSEIQAERAVKPIEAATIAETLDLLASK